MKTTVATFEQFKNNSDLRLEPEFWINSSTTNIDYIGADIIEFVQYGTSKELNEQSQGFPILRLNEFEKYFITKPQKYCNIINQNTYNELKLKKDDVLICRTNGNPNYVGKAAIVTKDEEYAYASYLFKIRPKKSIINSATLTVYLNSKYGRKEINKYSMVGNQCNFSPAKFREICIPKFDSRIQEYVEQLVYKAYSLHDLSKDLYKETEDLLLKELGLLNWQPEHKLYSIKNYSEVEEANRLDAEYFQPKYDEIINTITQYSNGFDKLSNIVNIKKNIEVGSEEYVEKGIPFVRVSNLTKMEINDNNIQYITEKLYDNLAKTYQPRRDEILLSKDGTAGIAFFIDEQPKNMILSGGILRLKVKNKEYLPEYLTLVLNSLIVQQQVERVSSGALIKHWLIDEVNATLIPKLDINKQKEIVAKIQESSNCRKQSKQLLEIAKRGVEIAIEENEETATDWINNELSKIGVEL